MSSGVVSQSAPNWRIIKQLYLQGSKLPAPPQPNRDSSNEGLRECVSSLMVEMENLYRNSLAELEGKMQEAMLSYNRRIATLEEEVALLKKQRHQMKKGEQFSHVDEILPCPEAEAQPPKPTSLIHIEQDDGESLLQPKTIHKEPLILNSEMQTARRQMGRSAANVRRLFPDQSVGRMKHQSSEAMRPLSTKQSAYFERERDSREQLEVLRSCIQLAHGIKLHSHTFLPQVAVSVKDIEVEPSKNGLLHLRNENNQLRSRMLRLEQQLERTQYQLERIRQMLLRGLQQEDFGPYASVF